MKVNMWYTASLIEKFNKKVGSCRNITEPTPRFHNECSPEYLLEENVRIIKYFSNSVATQSVRLTVHVVNTKNPLW